MKPRSNIGNYQRGFTLVELLVVLLVVAVLALIWTTVGDPVKPRRDRILCANNLKQISLAMRVEAKSEIASIRFEAVKPNSTAIMTAAQAFQQWPYLQPKLLVCPSDRRPPAGSLKELVDANLSYFYATEGNETYPQQLLAGDRNLTTNGVALLRGPCYLTTGVRLGWTADLHRGRGNVAMADGSVQNFSGQVPTYTPLSGTTNSFKLLVP